MTTRPRRELFGELVDEQVAGRCLTGYALQPT